MKKKLSMMLLSAIMILLTGIMSLKAQSTIEDAFFDKVNYIGAFGNTNWTAGWANWTPQNTLYPAATITIPAGEITTNTTWSSSSALVGSADFSYAKLNSNFFEHVSYIGAFGSVDWTEGWANWTPQTTAYPATTDTIAAGDITANTTLSAGKVYLLDGWVYVKSGATLTIEPGTVIRGSKANKGAIIIEKGAKIIAEGTVANPIIFTSNQDAGTRSYGDWGGLIILGNARVNKVDPVIEGGPISTYGGSDDADSSGILKYVRIEFPGVAFQPDKEINGLTMGGVGSKTTIDYVQVSFCGDDSYEWFGGAVNARHLIAYRGWDDDFDTDYGYRGMVQFAVSLRDPAVADAGSGSNSFESDNDASGSEETPYTEPVFCNVSSFGPLVTPSTTVNANYKRAMHLRRNTRLSIFNSLFAGYVTGLLIDGTAAQANATAGSLNLVNSVMAGCKDYYAADFDSIYFNDATRKNRIITSNSDLGLTNPFLLDNPDFRPTQVAYLLNGWVYVKSGATLTIKPGTIIRGDKANKGALIVEKGAKIMAEGTADSPIVFTSNQDAGSRSYGDWGGIIILGNARTNKVDPVIEGGPISTYGGSDDADNSGVIKYVRIEFPGIAFQPDKEINGLTMGGVGSGTTIDHVQVSFCGDDSYEWFGGAVNAKHLIAFRGWDDDFDTDYGYRGMIQYAVSLRDPAVADAGSGSNSFESDNDASGSEETPYTQALFSNVSSFGPLVTPSATINPNYKRAMHLRRNTKLGLYNSVFAGFVTGLLIDGTAAQANATAGDLKVRNTFMAGCGDFYGADFDSSFFNTTDFENQVLVSNDDLMIDDPFNLDAPDFMPETGSPVLNASLWYDPVGIGDNAFEEAPYAMVYPNPFQGSARISIELASLSQVTVQLVDITGAVIGSIANESNVSGFREYPVHVSQKGIYFAIITVNGERQTIKLIAR